MPEIAELKVAKTTTRTLPVKLSQDELRERGDTLASVIQDLNTEQKRQTDQKAQMKAKLSELEARQTQLAIMISRREEDREVVIDVWHDFERGTVSEVRRDTGEELHSRHMTDEERQRSLPIGVDSVARH